MTDDVSNETTEGREIDEIEALRTVEPLLGRVFKSFSPKEFINRLSAFDRGIYNKYFRGFRIEKFNRPKLVEITRKEIFENGNELLAQFVTILWNREHRPLYNDMLDQVKTINEDVEAIEQITDEDAAKVLAGILEKGHDKLDVLLCVRMNDVRFSEDFISAELPLPSDD
jgi:hypothetical protein